MGTALPQVTTEFLVNIKNNSPKSLEKKTKAGINWKRVKTWKKKMGLGEFPVDQTFSPVRLSRFTKFWDRNPWSVLVLRIRGQRLGLSK